MAESPQFHYPQGSIFTPEVLTITTKTAGCWWLTPIILATWEAKIRRNMVQGQSRQIVQETPSLKIIRAKGTGDVA
jgi:hypothetical protein